MASAASNKRAAQYLGELLGDLMPQEGEKDDDRNGNSQQVKQNSTAHDFLLFLSLPVGKTGVKISDFSASRGRQTGSKGAEKQSGGEPQR
jgi:hypothetical protein